MTMPGTRAPTPSPARAVALAPVLLVAGLTMAGAAAAQDSATVEALQRQNEELQRQLDELRAQMQEIRQMLPAVTAPVAERPQAPPAGRLALPPSGPTELPPPVLVDGNPVVTSGNERVTLAISGQVNRAINLADDGSSTQTYYVDNDTSNSRVRFVGTGRVTDDLTLGSKIEVAIAPNESSEVSQNNEDSGTFFDERVVEVWGQSDEFGKISLGKGNTASDGTSEVDLSGTDVIMYASVADPVGGLQFRTKGGDLTGVAVNDAFNDFDGLSRKNRLRYDTPSLAGFSLAVSTITNGQYDAGLFWAAEVGGFKAAAAAALAKPNTDDVDYRADGSASILHVPTGLNLTLSSGFDESDDGGNPSSYYLKVGWIADFFDFGSTNFGVDVNRSVNNPTPSDSGWSFGGAVVQNISDFGLQLYSQVRYYELDRNNDPSVDGITAFTVGTRIKF